MHTKPLKHTELDYSAFQLSTENTMNHSKNRDIEQDCAGYLRKSELAKHFGVTPRCIDLWVDRGLLPPGLKLGVAQQSRKRWTRSDLAACEANMRRLSGNEN